MTASTKMAALIVAAGLPLAASAQKFPERQVRIIVPFAAGGGTDILARIVAQKLSDGWGQSVIVENRAGGGTVIGSELVARAAPDGHTLMLTANPHTSNPALVAKLPYDTVKDFAAVTMVASAPLLLVAHPSLPVRSVKELVALAKARPGELTYASSGNGGPQHLAGELFKTTAGVSILHVPYKGTAPALTDVLGGQVQLAFSSLLTVLPQVKAGKLRSLGITSLTRSETNPEYPTLAESGLPGFELVTWYGVFAPGATPRPVVGRIRDDIARALATPEVRDRLTRDGVQAAGTRPDEFAAFIEKEIDKVIRLVRAAKIKPE